MKLCRISFGVDPRRGGWLAVVVVVVFAVAMGLLSSPAGVGVARAAAKNPQPCQSAFPNAREKTIGKTTWYNREESVRMVLCNHFGLEPSADFPVSSSMVCGILAQVIGKGSDRFGVFADGACSGADIASDPKEPVKYVSAVCSWASDLLGIALKPAGALGGLACTLAPSVGTALGAALESVHEFDVAVDVIRRGKCIKYSPTHFGSPWLAEACADGDQGFSNLPTYKAPTLVPGSSGGSGSGGGAGSGGGGGSSPGGGTGARAEGEGGSLRIHAETPGGAFIQVTSGWEFSCGVRPGGAVECWGLHAVNEEWPPNEPFSKIASGETFTCGIRPDQTLACWGYAAPPPPSGTFVQVASDSNHACAVTTSGSATCWGNPENGQTSPPAGAYKQVTVGDDYGCGLRATGSLVCWGATFFGLPTEESGPFTQISGGAEHVCGLDAAGSVSCWGYDGQGQTNVPSGTFEQVSAAGYHTCALRVGGAIVCWGEEFNGENQVPGGSYVEIAAGRFHACARRADGTVTCWAGGAGVEFSS